MISSDITGGCNCGAVRYRITGPMRPIVACHCRECRRASGHYTAATRVAGADIEIDGLDAVQWYATSTWARRGFCRTCGCQLFFVPVAETSWGVFAGSLDGTPPVTLVGDIYVAEKGAYYPEPHRPYREEGDVPGLLCALGLTATNA
mgnify:CR=1 FL=1